MGKTKIEWTEYSWNPVSGCTPISEGCQNCYAKRMSKRLAGRCGYPADDPFRVTLHPERLDEPLKWKKPRRVFVCSMGDLFHEDVPFGFVDRVFAIMALTKQHTFLVLTKRPIRMRQYIDGLTLQRICEAAPLGLTDIQVADLRAYVRDNFPLPNVWLGVTAENQQRADERIPILLQIPAAVRFVSVEPMLGPIRLQRDWLMCPGGAEYGHGMSLTRVHAGGCCDRHPRIHWVICGSESGPNHRKTKIEWIRDLREQCISANVPFFLKQMEINGRMVKMPELDGKIWAQFPEVQYAS